MTARLATFVVFVIAGCVLGTWVADIPWVQDHLGASSTVIGVELLAMALGALAGMRLAGALLERHSSARVTRLAALVFCALMWLPTRAGSALMLAAILAVFGAANGALIVAMTVHGAHHEERVGRNLMSWLDGGWSLGFLGAAGVTVLVASARVDPPGATLIAAVVLTPLVWWVTNRIGPGALRPQQRAKRPSRHSRRVATLGLLALLCLLVEGALREWGGIYMHRGLHTDEALAAGGLTGLSIGMAAGRFVGDALRQRLGATWVLRGGMTSVATILGIVLVRADPVIAVIGYTLMGLGIANALPILTSAAARISPTAVAVVSAVGHIGFTAGPPVIGVLADRLGLPIALGLLCSGAAVVVAVLGRVEPIDDAVRPASS
jgi:predicted MFS family arabinose efflux permease